jgi:hypothetical protein
VARYFVDKIKFSGGRVLDALELGRLISKQGEIRLRVSSSLPSAPLSSTEIGITSGGIQVSQTTLIDGEIQIRIFEVDGESRSETELQKMIQVVGVQSEFWNQLSSKEEDYFSSILGGGVILFEIADSETYRSLALCGLDFAAPVDIDFLRSLDPYQKLFKLSKSLSELVE